VNFRFRDLDELGWEVVDNSDKRRALVEAAMNVSFFK
jgi:hypothetical protein